MEKIGYSEAPDFNAAGTLQGEIGEPKELKISRIQKILDRIFPDFERESLVSGDASQAELFQQMVDDERLSFL